MPEASDPVVAAGTSLAYAAVGQGGRRAVGCSTVGARSPRPGSRRGAYRQAPHLARRRRAPAAARRRGYVVGRVLDLDDHPCVKQAWRTPRCLRVPATDRRIYIASLSPDRSCNRTTTGTDHLSSDTQGPAASNPATRRSRSVRSEPHRRQCRSGAVLWVERLLRSESS